MTAFALLDQHLGTMAGYLLAGLAAIGASRARDWYLTRAGGRLIKKTVDRSQVTANFLSEVRALADCDRITINQFHNGEHFASGASVQKLTLTHYVMKVGVSMPVNPEGHAMSAVPATFMTNLLTQLFTDGYSICKNFEAPDPWVSRYQTMNGLHSVCLCLMPGRNAKEGFGIIAFCWLDEREFTPAEINQFLVYAKRASAFI